MTDLVEKAKFLQESSHSASFQKIDQDRTSTDSITVKGTFDSWNYYNKTTNQFVTSATLPPPTWSESKKKAPFQFTMKVTEANIVPDKLNLVGRDPSTGSATYQIVTDIQYVGETKNKDGTYTESDDPHTARKVLIHHLGRQQRGEPVNPIMVHTLSLVVTQPTPEGVGGGELRRNMWHSFQSGDDIKMKIFAPLSADEAALSKLRENGSPELQDMTPITVNRVSCSIRLAPYKPKEGAEGAILDGEEIDKLVIGCGRDAFAYMCGNIVAKTTDDNGEMLTANATMHAMYEKDKRPLVPYEKLVDSKIPYSNYFWVDKMFQNNDASFVSFSRDNLVISDFQWEKDGVKTPKYTFKHAFVYGPEETYMVNITAGDSTFNKHNVAHAFGTLDPACHAPIWINHSGFPCHVLANFSLKKTNQIDHNAHKTPDQRRGDGLNILGVYEFYASKVVPDWEVGLPRHGIPLSKDRMLLDFSNAAKREKDKSKRYFSEYIEDGDSCIRFKSAFTTPNPLHIDGNKSAVVNFGCGERPGFTCDHAMEVIDTMDFYVLTNRSISPIGSTAEGDAVFETLTKEPDFCYQIFGLRRKRQALQPVAATPTKAPPAKAPKTSKPKK